MVITHSAAVRLSIEVGLQAPVVFNWYYSTVDQLPLYPYRGSTEPPKRQSLRVRPICIAHLGHRRIYHIVIGVFCIPIARLLYMLECAAALSAACVEEKLIYTWYQVRTLVYNIVTPLGFQGDIISKLWHYII